MNDLMLFCGILQLGASSAERVQLTGSFDSASFYFIYLRVKNDSCARLGETSFSKSREAFGPSEACPFISYLMLYSSFYFARFTA